MIKQLFAVIPVLFAPAAASAKWHEANSAHFVVYADQDPEKLRAFATKLERFDKAMRFVRGLPDNPVGAANRLHVYAVADVGAVQRLAGSGVSNVAGFYIGRASGSIAFVPRRAGTNGKGDLNPDTIFFHEYAHHFMLGNYSGAYPAWFTEGFAEFYSTAKVEDDGSVGIGLPALHRAYGALSRDSLALNKMLSGDYKRLSPEQVEALYGRGWLLTHMLTFEPARREQLTVYLDRIGAGRPASEAATEAFGNLKVLDRDLNTYVNKRKMNYWRLPAASLPVAPVVVRPLRPGEAAFLPIRMRSTRGVDDKTAKALVSSARRAAAPYAADATVQAWLAEVEHDANNLADADAAADRALAVDAKNSDALIYKGRIAMKRAVADKSQDKTVWSAVRKWFIQAANADNEDAEPKMLFHASFAAAGATPTRNAVAALLYAQQLVPQDGSLRMQVVHQHLVDGKAAEARRLFGPIAYNPHAGAGRDWTGAVMAKLVADDAKGALTLWEEQGSQAASAGD